MLLAIDTATDQASIALGRAGREPLQEIIGGARRHAAALLPAIQTLLDRAGLSLRQVSGVVVSDGPGSFTGLRVGAAVAKALVHAGGFPLWVAPSLMVRAAGVAKDEALILAVSNALRGEVYAAAYRFLGNRIQTELQASVQRPAALVTGVLRPEIVVGEAPPEIVAELEAWIGQPVIGPPVGSPHAAKLLELVGQSGGASLVDAVSKWEPIYGRPAEAQARWEIAHGRPLPDSVGSSR
ncbi:MAG TPA: tRNA (adenosine(37)-N6)-threonylcarbamoyltransferase complex dimerization subunit type 1 TsaB [Gemmatimonadales bacterium]|nr:tRNA (adenosine(37)-N6)-threonylcarbamoyltransferase complex dimerization subunit type 1 TsaB [Gemmatimonadales bacterium]